MDASMTRKGIVCLAVFGLLSSCAPCRKEEPRAMMAPARVVTVTLNNVYFSYNKSDLSEQSKEILDRNANWLRANPDVAVTVEGYTDERGSSSYNLALGEKRAAVAAKYLESLGIDSARISTKSYGKENPLDPGHNEEAWSKNRRVAFSALGQQSKP